MTAESILRGLAGLALMVGLAYAFSSNRGAIRWRLVAVGTILQVLFALAVLNTAAGRNIFNWISKGFVVLFGFAAEGAAFVFGPLGRGPGADGSLGFFFAFQVLPIVIFFASLMAMLYYVGIMQRVVQAFAWVMARLLGTSGAESLSVSASTFIGQTEAPLVIRPYLPVLTTSELYTIMVSGMAHIAGSVMAAYVTMLATAYARVSGTALDAAQVNFAGHFLAASIMAAPATMVVAKMLVPETESPVTMGTVRLKIEKGYSNIIEAAAGGAGDGLRLALNIGAMLIAFIASIAVINFLLGWAGDVSGLNATLRAHYRAPLSLELLFGFIFQFVAYAIGVPWSDAMPVGSLMGIKLVLNEFVAYLRMAETVAAGTLSEKSIIIATYALCGFANFSSIGIQIGGLSPLAENKRGDIAKLGLRAVLGGTIATWMIASIAGMFVP